jgi:hypothetical protein
MPIEIKELHINVAVSSESPKKPAEAEKAASAALGKDDKNALIAECVEQVLKIIRDKVER